MDKVIENKIKIRHQCNKIILNILRNLIDLAPNIRFSQLLFCCGVLVYECKTTNPMETVYIKDDFATESYDVLMRLMEFLKKSHVDLYNLYINDVKAIMIHEED